MQIKPQNQQGHGTDIGVTISSDEVSFVLFAPKIKALWLCLFHADTEECVAKIPVTHYRAGYWQVTLDTSVIGLSYAYLADDQYIMDPAAKYLGKAIHFQAEQYQHERSLFIPKALIKQPRQRAEPNHISFAAHDRVIYETHVKGLTALHPDVPESQRGRYLGLTNPVLHQHLHALGVTTIQLQPLMAFMPEPFITAKGLTNYWGYNTAAFFAPEPRYACQDAESELISAVDALHAAGFEVLLDVVLNHTAEGGENGTLLHWQKIYPQAYLRDSQLAYINNTGCGNSVNIADPFMLQFMLDSLRHWHQHFGFDGFRFDLATSLGRDPFDFDPQAAFFRAIKACPVLRKTTLIAEPWDIGYGGYQLGNFPVEWLEINDRFRDVVRCYWRGDEGQKAKFATCLFGSRDIFHKHLRASNTSVNGITHHDGFCLQDLVSYNDKHNEANREDNRDGHNTNHSANYGIEGDTSQVPIIAQREQQKRNMYLTLMLAQGTPFINGGDELSKTHHGNNNVYCQDNEINYYHWVLSARQQDFLHFCQRTAQLRQSSEILKYIQLADDHFHSYENVSQVNWYRLDGELKAHTDWHAEHNQGFAVELIGNLLCPEQWLLIFNPCAKSFTFSLPQIEQRLQWSCMLSTADAQGCSELTVQTGQIITVPAHVSMVFKVKNR